MSEHLQSDLDLDLDLDLETTSPSLDCEGDEDRGPGDDPDTDDEFIKVMRGADYEFEGEILQLWTWTGDPLYTDFESADYAKAGAARHYSRFRLEWWEEHKDYWMSARPGCRMTEEWGGSPDDCDEDEIDGTA